MVRLSCSGSGGGIYAKLASGMARYNCARASPTRNSSVLRSLARRQQPSIPKSLIDTVLGGWRRTRTHLPRSQVSYELPTNWTEPASRSRRQALLERHEPEKQRQPLEGRSLRVFVEVVYTEIRWTRESTPCWDKTFRSALIRSTS